MGFSPRSGLKDTDGKEFHVEAKDKAVVIWEADEMRHILRLSYEEARKLADDLDLVCTLKEGD